MLELLRVPNEEMLLEKNWFIQVPTAPGASQGILQGCAPKKTPKFQVSVVRNDFAGGDLVLPSFIQRGEFLFRASPGKIKQLEMVPKEPK